jgi:DNA-binding LacI/PurR family transcriptional regulator
MLLSNDRQGSYDATRYFIDQGRRKIAFMGYESNLPNLKERERGFVDALQDVQQRVETEWLYQGPLSNQHGYAYAQELFTTNKFPDAVLCGSAEAATGWLAFCQEVRVAVPSQLALMTWDETNYCDFFRPSISTIAQKGTEMGVMASQILLENIGKSTVMDAVLKLFRPRLTHRTSSSFSKDQGIQSDFNPLQTDTQRP